MDDFVKGAGLSGIAGIGWLIRELRKSSRSEKIFREKVIKHMASVAERLESISDKVDRLESTQEKLEEKMDTQVQNLQQIGSQSHEFLHHLNQVRGVLIKQGHDLLDYSDYKSRKKR